MNHGHKAVPVAVLIYGLFGIIPFLAPPIAGFIIPEVKTRAGFILVLYGGLILSFLGGARWGFANAHPPPAPRVVSISMVPTLAALALLAAPADWRRSQLIGLAAALALHWLWDLRATGLPAWYARLRTMLTAGAIAGLLAGIVALT
jgi:hypothetical protein